MIRVKYLWVQSLESMLEVIFMPRFNTATLPHGATNMICGEGILWLT